MGDWDRRTARKVNSAKVLLHVHPRMSLFCCQASHSGFVRLPLFFTGTVALQVEGLSGPLI